MAASLFCDFVVSSEASVAAASDFLVDELDDLRVVPVLLDDLRAVPLLLDDLDALVPVVLEDLFPDPLLGAGFLPDLLLDLSAEPLLAVEFLAAESDVLLSVVVPP